MKTTTLIQRSIKQSQSRATAYIFLDKKKEKPLPPVFEEVLKNL